MSKLVLIHTPVAQKVEKWWTWLNNNYKMVTLKNGMLQRWANRKFSCDQFVAVFQLLFWINSTGYKRWLFQEYVVQYDITHVTQLKQTDT